MKSPQTNGIVERFHKTVLNEFYRVAFRRNLYTGTDQLQTDLDGWLRWYKELPPIRGAGVTARHPMQTFLMVCRWRTKSRSIMSPPLRSSAHREHWLRYAAAASASA